MRNLNDEEWLDLFAHSTQGAVKCRWLFCAHGQGLAGHGVCSAGGEWNQKDCPEFVTDEDFSAAWEKRERESHHRN